LLGYGGTRALVRARPAKDSILLYLCLLLKNRLLPQQQSPSRLGASAGSVRLLPVEVERDSGAEIEIRSGLTGSERVIRAPRPDVVDGLAVQMAS